MASWLRRAPRSLMALPEWGPWARPANSTLPRFPCNAASRGDAFLRMPSGAHEIVRRESDRAHRVRGRRLRRERAYADRSRYRSTSSVWRLRQHAVAGLIRPVMRRRRQLFAESFSASNVASGGGAPDLATPIRGVAKSEADDLPVEGIARSETLHFWWRRPDRISDRQGLASESRGRPRPAARW